MANGEEKGKKKSKGRGKSGPALPTTNVTIGKDKIKGATVIDLTQGTKNRIYVVIEKIDPTWAGKVEWPACCAGPLLYFRRR